jgi:hypothetical protein
MAASVYSPGSHHGHRDALCRPRVCRRLRLAAGCCVPRPGPGPGRLARRWRVPPARRRNRRSLLRGVRWRKSPCGCLTLPLSVPSQPSLVRVQSSLSLCGATSPVAKMGAAGGRPRRLATATRRWPVARDRSPAWFGTCSEGFLCAPVARTIFLTQDVHIFLPNMIAVAGGGTNAMDVSKNVRACRCTRCPARLQACCPGGGLILLVAWISADFRQVLLQRPHTRHPSQILEGLLSRYRLARGAFASYCRS